MKNVKLFFLNQYKLLLFLILGINLPYILLKNYFDNKVPTLHYIFLALLILIRIFFNPNSDNVVFKSYREKYPHLSKSKIVNLIQLKKAHNDWAFGLIFLILIFSYLLNF